MASGSSPLSCVPNVPTILEAESQARSLLNIWESYNRLSKECNNKAEVPLTVVVADFNKVSNLVPMGAPNPLYIPDDFSKEFILDYLSAQSVNIDSLTQANPLTIKSMSGKDLTFEKSADGSMTVNGVLCGREPKVLSDGRTTIISINDVLFNHREETKKAWKNLK